MSKTNEVTPKPESVAEACSHSSLLPRGSSLPAPRKSFATDLQIRFRRVPDLTLMVFEVDCPRPSVALTTTVWVRA